MFEKCRTVEGTRRFIVTFENVIWQLEVAEAVSARRVESASEKDGGKK